MNMLTTPIDTPHNSPCSNCRHASTCLPSVINLHELKHTDGLIEQDNRVSKGQVLIDQNKPVKQMVMLRTGSAKSQVIHPSSEKTIHQFYYPGDLLGLQDFHHDCHRFSIITLEASAVCRISIDRLQALSHYFNPLERALFLLLSHQIERQQQLHHILTFSSSRQRVARFLIHIAQLHQARGLSSNRYQLAMKRSELGAFLGLSLETVSRSLSLLQQHKLIKFSGKSIEILAMQPLLEYADG